MIPALAIAQEINADIVGFQQKMIWSGVPDYNQLLEACRLICAHISKPKSIVNERQLEVVIRQFFSSGSYSKYLKQQIEGASEEISDVIDITLARIRNVISYQFPRNLMVLQRIQEYVFKKNGIEITADYSFYASTLENLHMDSALCALDEYGVPYQTAEKL